MARHDARHGAAFTIGPRLILGLGVISVGLVLTLDNFGVLEAGDMLIYWPLILVGIGLTRIFNRDLSSMVFSLGFILIGLWILAFNLDLTDLEPWEFFWPLVLIAAGCVLAFGALRPHRQAGANDGSTLNAVAVLAGVERKSNSPNFQGGELAAFMGGCEVDLTRAGITEGQQPVIRAFALWGGVEIQVPKGWSVDSQVLPLLGAFEDTTEPPPASDGPRLMIQGVVIMGGIEVKN